MPNEINSYVTEFMSHLSTAGRPDPPAGKAFATLPEFTLRRSSESDGISITLLVEAYDPTKQQIIYRTMIIASEVMKIPGKEKSIDRRGK